MTSGSSGLSEEKIIKFVMEKVGEVRDKWIGVGDDTALIDIGKRRILFTIDVMNEGTHFLNSFFQPVYLGWKVVAINVSDIVVKGGKPVACVIYLNLPAAPSRKWIKDFLKGVSDASRKFGVYVVGGNTSRGALSAGCAMIGVEEHRFIKRHRAREGDYIYLCGEIGLAGKGLELIKEYGFEKAIAIDEKATMAFLKPSPPVEIFRRVLKKYRVTSSVDLSDSLYESLKYLISDKCDAVLESLPVEDDMVEFALYGGEDYAFLFSSNHQIPESYGVRKLGRVVKGTGKVIIKIPHRKNIKRVFRHF